MTDNIMLLENFPSWQSELDPSLLDEVVDPLAEGQQSKFPVRTDLNTLISLWIGKIWLIACDAIVNAGEEDYRDRRGMSDFIFKGAGPLLDKEVSQVMLEGPNQHYPRTGDAILTNGYNLPCKKVIHTVGPRYNDKYLTAVENMLHSCYRACMQILVENRLSTIAFSCIHSDRKHYEAKDAAPIALRTIRRFLERYPGKLTKIILVMQSKQEYDTYAEQLKLYFPRCKQEEIAALRLLPEDTGNEIGETISKDRMIRVNIAPGTHQTTDTTTTLTAPTIGARSRRNLPFAGVTAMPLAENGELDTSALAKSQCAGFGRVSVIAGSSKYTLLFDDDFCAVHGDVDAGRRERIFKQAQNDPNCAIS